MDGINTGVFVMQIAAGVVLLAAIVAIIKIGHRATLSSRRQVGVVVEEEETKDDKNDRAAFVKSRLTLRPWKAEVPAEDPETQENAKDDPSESSSHTCLICLNDFENGDLVSVSNNPSCRHGFHQDCIQSWLAKNETCPTCREIYLRVEESV